MTTRRHRWQPLDDGYGCAECPATCPACHTCDGPTGNALAICQSCLDHYDQVLTDITDALSHWQPEPDSPIAGIRYDRDRRGSGLDDERIPLDLRETPDDITAHLLDWVAMWAELSGQAADLDPVDYLRGRHMWAAHHVEESAWHDYRREVKQLRHRARRVAGLLPQRQAGACIYCGGQVVRDWSDRDWQPRTDGLADELRCTSCDTTWGDGERYRFAIRHTIGQLPETSPDALITREQARIIFPAVPAVTWRQWVHLDAQRAEAVQRWADLQAKGHLGPAPEPERMPVRSWDVRGVALYRLADLTMHVERWFQRAARRLAG